jgi:TPR repeat protein
MLAFAAGSALPVLATDDAPDAAVIASLREDAADGKPESKIALANVLAYGEGATPERQREAALWYRRAAEQGDAEGQFTLALWLWLGQNVEENRIEAVKWWQKAADQDRADAQFWLAGAYEAGEGGVPKDLAAAAKWYRRSADQGFDESQASLGQMYAEGAGVPQNDREAVRWLRKAADQHCASGEHYLAVLYAAGRGVPKDEKEAVRLYLLAAEADFTVSMTALGEAYEKGRGVTKDSVCAYFWYGFAAKRGFSVGEDDRDALALKLSKFERELGERMVAAADFKGDVLERPNCPSEKGKRDAPAPKPSAAARTESQRPVAASAASGNMFPDPVGPGEPISIHVTNADLGDVLRIFETMSGHKILGIDDKIADLKVTLQVDELPWETALTQALDGKGYAWKREGEAIRIEPKTKQR